MIYSWGGYECSQAVNGQQPQHEKHPFAQIRDAEDILD